MKNSDSISFKKAFLFMLLSFLTGLSLSYVFLSRKSASFNVSDSCSKCDYSAEPEFTHISQATAHDLADRYVSECQPALTAVINRDSILDARCVQFSLTNLKKYIWDLESKVCGCDSFKNLGIRFYFGKYPDLNSDEAMANPDLNRLDKKYSFLHTVFLVPTFQTADGVNQDFEPLDITNCRTGNPRPPDSPMSLMNHGNLSPPPFPAAPGGPPPNIGLKY